jgi:Phosphoesterase family
MKPFGHKLPFLLGFIVILILVTQTKNNLTTVTAIVEANQTNTTTINSGLNYSNQTNTNQTNTNMTLNNAIQHVIFIIMENKGYTQVIGSSDAPYQNELAKKYASASKYYGVYPDSLPNYISIIAGYPYLTNDKDPGTMAPLKEPTIVNLLQSKNLTWKGYFEDMPDVCHLKDSGKSGYIVHHNPFVYFDIRNDDRCKNTVGLDNFYEDLSNNTLPNFSFVVPNNIHDSHDSTVADGDHWLSTFVPEIINSSAFNNTALFIVYDEGQKHDKSGFGSGKYAVTGGRLPLIVVSPLANDGYVSNAEYTHYNLLSTVEKFLNLGNLGKGDSTAKVMSDLFRTRS